MSLRIRWIAATLLCMTLACSSQQEQAQARAPEQEAATQAPPSEGKKLDALVESFFEEMLEMDPLLATSIGDHRYDDRFENTIGPEYRKRYLDLHARYLRDLRSIDPRELDDPELLTYEVFKHDREIAVRGAAIPDHLVPLNQVSSALDHFAQLGSGGGLQPFETVEDYERFLSRMEGFVAWMDQAMVNMRDGIKQGVVLPKVIVERILPMLESHVVANPRESIFYIPVLSFPAEMAEDQRLRLSGLYEAAIQGRLIPAYRRVRDFVRDEYMRHARDQVGLEAVPGGDRWYAFLVERHTTTTLKPEVIHQIGLNEVKRIHLELRDVQARAGFAGSMRDFFVHMSQDPGLVFQDGDSILDGYQRLRGEVHGKLGALFDIFPQGEYQIRAVDPSLQESAPAASYEPAPLDGSVPAILRVNTGGLASRPRWAMTSLFLHEAEPGHHLQIGIQEELAGLPRFRRFGAIPAFAEGWGLYAEGLGAELGLYDDPHQQFGALSADLWRAIRLVVDTGLHHGGWTADQALAYMVANAAVDETLGRAEVERYIAVPAEALAYKIGQLKISAMRTIAERKLGGAFDIKAFHREVLEDGALPIEVLQLKIDRWIKAREGARKVLESGR